MAACFKQPSLVNRTAMALCRVSTEAGKTPAAVRGLYGDCPDMGGRRRALRSWVGLVDRGHLGPAGVTVEHANGRWGFRPHTIRRADQAQMFILVSSEMTDRLIVGIDVSKDWLDLCASDVAGVERIANTCEAVAAWLERGAPRVIACAATGRYRA